MTYLSLASDGSLRVNREVNSIFLNQSTKISQVPWQEWSHPFTIKSGGSLLVNEEPTRRKRKPVFNIQHRFVHGVHVAKRDIVCLLLL